MTKHQHDRCGCFSVVRYSSLQIAEKHWTPWTERDRHCRRGCQRQKKGSGCLRKSHSSLKELVACTSGGGKRSDSKVHGVVHTASPVSRAFGGYPETYLPTLQVGHCHREPWFIHGPYEVDNTRKKLWISSTGSRVWNEGCCSKQWAAARSSSTNMGWVFCFWTAFPSWSQSCLLQVSGQMTV